MSDLEKQVNDILGNVSVPYRHTFFQLNFFTLGKEPTHQAKLRRCVDELRLRKQSLAAMRLEVEELRDKNELLAAESGPEIKLRMAKRRIAHNNKVIDSVLEKIVGTEEEMLFFVEAFGRLSEVERIRDWDETDVQLEYWGKKLEEEIVSRMRLRLPLDFELVRTALSLPPESAARKRIESILSVRAITEKKEPT